jgi:hypothetical protein
MNAAIWFGRSAQLGRTGAGLLPPFAFSGVGHSRALEPELRRNWARRARLFLAPFISE